MRFPVFPIVVAVALPLVLPPASRGQQADPDRAQEVNWKGPHSVRFAMVLRNYYKPRHRQSDLGRGCSADQGELCFNGDHEDQYCYTTRCRSPEDSDEFLARLIAYIDTYPHDALAFAQTVYAYTRLKGIDEALTLAERCTFASWWCELLLGMVHDHAGRPREAEALFRAALPNADPELASRLAGVGHLLDERDSGYERMVGLERADFEHGFWWLTDPMWTIPGNDRWTRHVRRKLELVLHGLLLHAIRERHSYGHERFVTRRGHEDSWTAQGIRASRWTSMRAARYRFTPVSAAADGIGAVRYDLMAEKNDERYTPGAYGPVFELPSQFARFLKGDSLAVAAAALLDKAELVAPETVFLLSHGPGRFPVRRQSETGAPRQVFQAVVAQQPVVVGIESIYARRVVARARGGLPVLSTDGLELSDPLMLVPDTGSLPGSRDSAVAAMMATTIIESGSELAVYWEVYGVVTGQPLELSVSIEGTRKGFFTRVLRALRIRGDAEGPLVAWTESADAPIHPMALVLDIGALEDGQYVLRIEVAVPDGSRATTTRSFTVTRCGFSECPAAASSPR